MPIEVFFCYAREDESLLNDLKSHLKPLQRQQLIDLWYDRDISAGAEWEHEIDEHLKKAQIILLLISPNFMNSDYCYSIEMKKAIERHERKETRVIPVVLRHTYWQGEPLGKLQALPKDAKPVLDRHWYSIDEAFYNVVEGIRAAIEDINQQQATSKITVSQTPTTNTNKAPTVNDINSSKDTKKTYMCNFCGKTNLQVICLIAGPRDVYICDECIEFCVEIVEEEGGMKFDVIERKFKRKS